LLLLLEPWVLSRTKAHECNYECGFCFHTAKTSYVAPIAEAKRGLKLLADAGMKKINFAGGEPFLYPVFMAKILA
jgi:radical S-adenosyl methionine domain-containing protein 2